MYDNYLVRPLHQHSCIGMGRPYRFPPQTSKRMAQAIVSNDQRMYGQIIPGNLRTVHVSWWRHQMEISHVIGPLCGEFTSHRWIPLTKASDAELWYFLWSASEQSKQSIHRWFGTQSHSWCHCNIYLFVVVRSPEILWFINFLADIAILNRT